MTIQPDIARGRPAQPIRHGTVYAYKRHKCRCDDCRAAANAAVTQYRRACGVRPIGETGNPCQHGGIVYPSQAAAARALGVADATICFHLTQYGNLDRLGASRTHGKGGRKVPVRIGGREWPSRPVFAEWLGIPVTTLRAWLRRKDTQRILAAVMQADARDATLRQEAA